MILVDSNIWINFFNDNITPRVRIFQRMLGIEPILLGDVIKIEILQGFATKEHFKVAKKLLKSFEQVSLLTPELTENTINLSRHLRDKNITKQRTIDNLIANYCITTKTPLLTDDKGFQQIAKHSELQLI